MPSIISHNFAKLSPPIELWKDFNHHHFLFINFLTGICNIKMKQVWCRVLFFRFILDEIYHFSTNLYPHSSNSL